MVGQAGNGEVQAPARLHGRRGGLRRRGRARGVREGEGARGGREERGSAGLYRERAPGEGSETVGGHYTIDGIHGERD
jgi:hypothetical protein